MSIVLQGSTSGSITLQEPAVAGSTVLSLPATSGTLITTGSSGQVIPKAALPTGSVLQVVNGTLTTTISTTSTSFVDTGVTVSITPLFSTSKILVTVCLNGITNSGNNLTLFNILRNGTAIIFSTAGGAANTAQAFYTHGGASNSRITSNGVLTYLDSPSTTSALTYKVQMRVDASTGYLNQWGLNTDAASVSTITVQEIAA